jgi:hypothetical protein
MTPGFFDVVKVNAAGYTARTAEPPCFAKAKKAKSELLILTEAGH